MHHVTCYIEVPFLFIQTHCILTIWYVDYRLVQLATAHMCSPGLIGSNFIS